MWIRHQRSGAAQFLAPFIMVLSLLRSYGPFAPFVWPLTSVLGPSGDRRRAGLGDTAGC
jgi:hypothetical protein